MFNNNTLLQPTFQTLSPKFDHHLFLSLSANLDQNDDINNNIYNNLLNILENLKESNCNFLLDDKQQNQNNNNLSISKTIEPKFLNNLNKKIKNLILQRKKNKLKNTYLQQEEIDFKQLQTNSLVTNNNTNTKNNINISKGNNNNDNDNKNLFNWKSYGSYYSDKTIDEQNSTTQEHNTSNNLKKINDINASTNCNNNDENKNKELLIKQKRNINQFSILNQLLQLDDDNEDNNLNTYLSLNDDEPIDVTDDKEYKSALRLQKEKYIYFCK